MNKYLTLLALLACVSVANAVTCHANGVDVSGTCYCKQGYWGTDASSATGDCAACPSNSTTDTPGATNTAAGLKVNACKKCASGYIMTVLPVDTTNSEAAATCVVCDTNSTNDAITSAVAT